MRIHPFAEDDERLAVEDGRTRCLCRNEYKYGEESSGRCGTMTIAAKWENRDHYVIKYKVDGKH